MYVRILFVCMCVCAYIVCMRVCVVCHVRIVVKVMSVSMDALRTSRHRCIVVGIVVVVIVWCGDLLSFVVEPLQTAGLMN
jgi:hypothetical protein